MSKLLDSRFTMKVDIMKGSIILLSLFSGVNALQNVLSDKERGDSRSLRVWTPRYYEINFTDVPYQTYNSNREDFVHDEVILSNDGKRIAIKGSNPNDESFYAIYLDGAEFQKDEYVYFDKPGNFTQRVKPGDSFSFSRNTETFVIGNSRCDSMFEYAEGHICIQADLTNGPDFNKIQNNDITWGKSVSLCDNAEYVAVGSSQGQVSVYNMFSLLLINNLDTAKHGSTITVEAPQLPTNALGEIVKLAGDQDNLTLVIGGKGDKITVHRYDDATSNDWYQLGSDIPTDGNGKLFDCSYNGNIVAVAYGDTIVRVHQSITSDAGNTDWNQMGQDLIVDNDRHASLSLSDDGSRLAVGSHRGNLTGGEPGHVKVYEFVGNEWVEMSFVVEGKQDVENEVDFGKSISLSGNGKLLAVAAPALQNVTKDIGYAMVFELGDPFPSSMPSSQPTGTPTSVPSTLPTVTPTSQSSLVPSSQPSLEPLPTVTPSTEPSHVPSVSPTTSPTYSMQPSPSPTKSVQPSPAPSPLPTSSTCLFNCDCKDGGNCDMSQCLYNCNCEGGDCDMSECQYDCRCKGGNCNMKLCESNCQCDMRGCQMDNCIYNGRCVSAGGGSNSLRSSGSVRRSSGTLITLMLGIFMAV